MDNFDIGVYETYHMFSDFYEGELLRQIHYRMIHMDMSIYDACKMASMAGMDLIIELVEKKNESN